MTSPFDILHHGAVNGVTGSCHELQYKSSQNQKESILIDCGLFQGIETELDDSDLRGSLLATHIPFDIAHNKSLGGHSRAHRSCGTYSTFISKGI